MVYEQLDISKSKIRVFVSLLKFRSYDFSGQCLIYVLNFEIIIIRDFVYSPCFNVCIMDKNVCRSKRPIHLVCISENHLN